MNELEELEKQKKKVDLEIEILEKEEDPKDPYPNTNKPISPEDLEDPEGSDPVDNFNEDIDPFRKRAAAFALGSLISGLLVGVILGKFFL